MSFQHPARKIITTAIQFHPVLLPALPEDDFHPNVTCHADDIMKKRHACEHACRHPAPMLFL
jgi:hypothetical protein